VNPAGGRKPPFFLPPRKIIFFSGGGESVFLPASPTTQLKCYDFIPDAQAVSGGNSQFLHNFLKKQSIGMRIGCTH
jgi:hypothetical protein